MRAPKRKRPLRRAIKQPSPSPEVLRELSSRVSYLGSPEHKLTNSFAGHPRPRADASICASSITKLYAERLLRRAIKTGNISDMFDGEFPRYAWIRDRNSIYEARLTNKTMGQYKGYPLNHDEIPEGLQ